MGRKDLIKEVQSMLHSGGWAVAKEIVELSEKEPDHFKKVYRGMARRSMSSQEAKRMVDAARARIAAADEDETEKPGTK